MNVQTLRITGMTCDHCAKSIEEALAGMAGVVEAQVSYDEGTARIKTEAGVDSAKLIDTVQGKGFDAEVLDRKGSTVAKGVPDRPHISVVDTPTPSVKPRRSSRGALEVAIIGSGGAAFACAIRAAEEGAKVTLIERGTLGGTCVNVGCVPSKIMIRAAHLAHLQSDHPFDGIKKRTAVLDRRALLAQQQGRVEELRHAKYESILESNPRITLVRGFAHFDSGRRAVTVKQPDGKEKRLRADRVLIANRRLPLDPRDAGSQGYPLLDLDRGARGGTIAGAPHRLRGLGGGRGARAGVSAPGLEGDPHCALHPAVQDRPGHRGRAQSGARRRRHAHPDPCRREAGALRAATGSASASASKPNGKPSSATACWSRRAARRTRRASGSRSSGSRRTSAAPSSSMIICGRAPSMSMPPGIARRSRSSCTWRRRPAPVRRST